MKTALVWLLISLGSNGGHSARPSALIEHFDTREDCIAVMKILNGSTDFSGIHTCVPAKVIVK